MNSAIWTRQPGLGITDSTTRTLRLGLENSDATTRPRQHSTTSTTWTRQHRPRQHDFDSTTSTTWTRKPGLGNTDSATRPRQPGLDNLDSTTRTRQHRLHNPNTTTRIRQPGLDSLDSTAPTPQPELDNSDSTLWTRLGRPAASGVRARNLAGSRGIKATLRRMEATPFADDAFLLRAGGHTQQSRGSPRVILWHISCSERSSDPYISLES